MTPLRRHLDRVVTLTKRPPGAAGHSPAGLTPFVPGQVLVLAPIRRFGSSLKLPSFDPPARTPVYLLQPAFHAHAVHAHVAAPETRAREGGKARPLLHRIDPDRDVVGKAQPWRAGKIGHV